MSMLAHTVRDTTLLDLFAGSGALGLEALSRGAASVVFVDQSRDALSVIRANVELLSAAVACTVVADDVFSFLSRLDRRVDIALADPPYDTGAAARLVERYVDRPFANELWLEHPFREVLPFPAGAKTRRYGDTALTTLKSDP